MTLQELLARVPKEHTSPHFYKGAQRVATADCVPCVVAALLWAEVDRLLEKHRWSDWVEVERAANDLETVLTQAGLERPTP